MSEHPRDSDMTGKIVVLRKDVHKPAFQDIKYLIFRCEGGFGCKPFTSGSAVFGVYLHGGEHARVNKQDVERYATPEEVELVGSPIVVVV